MDKAGREQKGRVGVGAQRGRDGGTKLEGQRRSGERDGGWWWRRWGGGGGGAGLRKVVESKGKGWGYPTKGREAVGGMGWEGGVE